MALPLGRHVTKIERLDEAMEVAAALRGHDAIGSFHVALDDRPNYETLLHYRRLAEANGMELTVSADSIVLRPKEGTQ